MNEKAWTTFALLLLLLAGAQLAGFSSANFFPDPGPDLPRIYIRGDGNVEPDTAPIEQTGNTYKLTCDILQHTIVIECGSIVLDGSGCSIQGNRGWMGTDRVAGNNGIIVSGQHDINITGVYFAGLSVGVRISGSSNITIAGNSFDDAVVNMATPTGLIIDESSFVLIENNNFTRMKAISGNGTHLTIRGNILTDGSIELKGTSNIIENNHVETPFESLRIGAADSNIISKNRIIGEVSFLSCSNTVISENNITGMRILPAITITFGSNNTVYNNRLENNAVILELTRTANNTFYANTFPANCSVRVNDAGANFWDNGAIGNYWSDYNGSDSNGDGIGDTPYTVTGYKWDNHAGGDVSFVAGQDNYPLTAPYENENGVAVLPQMPPYHALFAAAIVVIVATGLLLYKRKRQKEAKQT